MNSSSLFFFAKWLPWDKLQINYNNIGIIYTVVDFFLIFSGNSTGIGKTIMPMEGCMLSVHSLLILV